MTPAEFYVSSDALVHLLVSTEYLKQKLQNSWLDALPSKQKLSSRGQSTTGSNASAKG